MSLKVPFYPHPYLFIASTVDVSTTLQAETSRRKEEILLFPKTSSPALVPSSFLINLRRGIFTG
jgi:hypothetical protein